MNHKTFYCQWTLSNSPPCREQCNICKTMENEMLNDIKKETPAKFKINYIGVFFVTGAICIIWKLGDLIAYLIHKFL